MAKTFNAVTVEKCALILTECLLHRKYTTERQWRSLLVVLGPFTSFMAVTSFQTDAKTVIILTGVESKCTICYIINYISRSFLFPLPNLI